MKKTVFALVFVLLLLLGIGLYLARITPVAKDKEEETSEIKNVISMCYFYSKPTQIGFEDRAWLRMDIDGEKVVGEYNYFPAGKDSKVGDFSGTVGSFDPKISGRRASVTWNALQEGMNTSEELMIEFGEGSAVTFYGEMSETGPNTYVYKDKNNLKPSFQMWQVDCTDLLERLAVEEYVRNNIMKIATDKPVLGATTWFVISTAINTNDNTGEVVYEDGHIQGKGTFAYNFNPSKNTVQIINFKSKEN